MTLVPLFDAPYPIILHTVAAVLAFVLGLSQFCLPKGTARHRLLGWIWVILLMSVASSAFFIHSLDDTMSAKYIVVHLLTACTLIVVPLAVYYARRRMVRAHATWMIVIFSGALVLAGMTAFLPGRIMYAVVTGKPVVGPRN